MGFMIKFLFYGLGVLFVASKVADFSLSLAFVAASIAVVYGALNIGDINA